MKRLHDADARASLAARIGRLTSKSQRQWGKMSVDQMVHHMNSTMKMTIGELETAPRGGWFKRVFFRWYALNLPWPKGKAPTAPELRADAQYDLDRERTELLTLLEAVGARPIDGPWPRHPAFGWMSGKEWSRLQYRHVDFHLQQFGV